MDDARPQRDDRQKWASDLPFAAARTDCDLEVCPFLLVAMGGAS